MPGQAHRAAAMKKPSPALMAGHVRRRAILHPSSSWVQIAREPSKAYGGVAASRSTSFQTSHRRAGCSPLRPSHSQSPLLFTPPTTTPRSPFSLSPAFTTLATPPNAPTKPVSLPACRATSSCFCSPAPYPRRCALCCARAPFRNRSSCSPRRAVPCRAASLYLFPRQTPATHSTLHSARPHPHSHPAPLRHRANGARPCRPPRLPRGRAAPARAFTRAGARPASAGARSGPPPRPSARPRHSPAARRRRLVLRARHLLRRRRRFRHHGWGVRLREPVQPGLRHQHGGAEHRALQQRAELRGLLRGPLQPGRHRGRRAARVPAGLHRGDGHQLLPAQLRPALRRRRLVQPAPRPLRHGPARLPAHRALQGRHCPSFLPQGCVPEEGRHPFHHQRPLLLQPGPRHQRRRARRRALGGRQVGPLGGVAGPVPQLGPELAEQRAPRRPVPLLPRHRRRRPLCRLQQGRPPRLVLRPDIQRRPVRLNLRQHRQSGVVLLSTSSSK